MNSNGVAIVASLLSVSSNFETRVSSAHFSLDLCRSQLEAHILRQHQVECRTKYLIDSDRPDPVVQTPRSTVARVFSQLFMTTIVDLDAEYRLTRAALVDAGVEMTDSMDTLYRDWRRWRDRSGARAAVGSPRNRTRGSLVGSSPCTIPKHDGSGELLRERNEYVNSRLPITQARILREANIRPRFWAAHGHERPSYHIRLARCFTFRS